MKLHKKPTYLRKVDEPPRKKRINIGKIIYQSILLIIAILILFNIVEYFIYTEGFGQVMITRMNVQEIKDIRINEYLVKEGDRVLAGEPLFTYTNRESNNTLDDSDIKRNQSKVKPIKKSKEYIDLWGNLELKKVKRNYLRKELKLLKENKKNIEYLINYKVETIDKLNIQKNKIRKKKHELDLIVKEIFIYQNRLTALKKQNTVSFENDYKQQMIVTDNEQFNILINESDKNLKLTLNSVSKNIKFFKQDSCYILVDALIPELPNKIFNSKYIIKHTISKDTLKLFINKKFKPENLIYLSKTKQFLIKFVPKDENIEQQPLANYKISYVDSEVFISRFDGMITRIFFDEYEVVLKGMSIMNIFRAGNLHIKGFFEQKDRKYLNPGKEVTIKFPDGEKIKGVISRIYFATLPQPPEFQKKYEPVNRSMIVDIEPVSKIDEISMELYKMGVSLFVKKY